MAGRIKEKDLHRKFCKSFVENQLYFNKNENFEDDEKKEIDGISFFWLKNIKTDKYLEKRFQREKMYLFSGNFI